jgi:hypothetical protein
MFGFLLSGDSTDQEGNAWQQAKRVPSKTTKDGPEASITQEKAPSQDILF